MNATPYQATLFAHEANRQAIILSALRGAFDFEIERIPAPLDHACFICLNPEVGIDEAGMEKQNAAFRKVHEWVNLNRTTINPHALHVYEAACRFLPEPK